MRDSESVHRWRAPGRLIAFVFSVFIGLAVLSILLAPQYGVSKYNRGAVVVGIIALLIASPRAWSRAVPRSEALEHHPVVRRMLVGAFVLALGMLAWRVGYALQVWPGWDPQVVVGTAANVAHGEALRPEINEYFSRYPNNLLLTAGLRLYFTALLRFGVGDLLHATIALNAVFLASAALVTYLCARRLASPTAGYAALLGAVPFVGLCPWVAVPYSDSFGLIMPPLCLYLYLRGRDAASLPVRASWVAALGLVTALAYGLKPPLLFAGVSAIAAIGFSVAKEHRLRRPTLVLLASLVIGGAAGIGSARAIVSYLPAEPPLVSHYLPFTSFMKMGAQEYPGPYNNYYGAYLPSDVSASLAVAPSARAGEGLRVWWDRVRAKGVLGYGQFLHLKVNWTMGDGTFFQWGEGNMSAIDEFDHDDRLSRALRQWLTLTGERRQLLVNWWQAVWLFVLVRCGLAVRQPFDPRSRGGATIVRLTILLAVALFALIETRPRYMFVFVPYFLLLAVLSFETQPGPPGPRPNDLREDPTP